MEYIFELFAYSHIVECTSEHTLHVGIQEHVPDSDSEGLDRGDDGLHGQGGAPSSCRSNRHPLCVLSLIY